ncbi:MAG: hypothetical protein JXA21_23320 [Anaerolineae bacterium]|nr:hypothetical protein [Anaerolineae bacterium]
MAENQVTQPKKRYPLLRALLVLVFYGGFLALLWYFPVASLRPFFQTLLRGFGYFIAGFVLFLITLLAFVLLPIPGVPEATTPAAKPTVSQKGDKERPVFHGLSAGRSLVIPELTTDEKDKVLDVLRNIEDEIDPKCAISVDARSGIVTVSEEDKREAAYVILELQSRLNLVGISIRVL